MYNAENLIVNVKFKEEHYILGIDITIQILLAKTGIIMERTDIG